MLGMHGARERDQRAQLGLVTSPLGLAAGLLGFELGLKLGSKLHGPWAQQNNKKTEIKIKHENK